MSWNEEKMIRVWSFYDAPHVFQNLSKHGGDEDWVAVVPPSMRDVYIPWLESSSFGCCDISMDELPNGHRVYIGAHA